MKTKTIGFDIELAKKIQNGEEQGRIKTRSGNNARVICWDRRGTDYPIIGLVEDINGYEYAKYYTKSGNWHCSLSKDLKDLVLEIPDDTQEEYRFKPFDKVLVRDSDEDKWTISLYSYADIGRNMYRCIDNFWEQCIPYEGNQELLGTTDKPKEGI